MTAKRPAKTDHPPAAKAPARKTAVTSKSSAAISRPPKAKDATDPALRAAASALQPRCVWAGNDAQMQAYHDTEWGKPLRDSRALWELLMLEGFQAGLAWITVLHKRAAFRQEFAGFDPAKVASFGEKDIARMLGNPGIIRSRAKIEATIRGAQLYCEMQRNGEDFAEFIWSFSGGKVLRGDGVTRHITTPLSETLSKALKKRGFKFVGPTIVYAFMQACGMVDDHEAQCFCR